MNYPKTKVNRPKPLLVKGDANDPQQQRHRQLGVAVVAQHRNGWVLPVAVGPLYDLLPLDHVFLATTGVHLKGADRSAALVATVGRRFK